MSRAGALDRPGERGAVGVGRRPVDGVVACVAAPCGVSAAMPEAGLMPDEHPGAEWVPVGASRRWVGDPLPGRGLHQLAHYVECRIMPSVVLDCLRGKGSGQPASA